MLINILIITKDRSALLAKCLNSLVAQRPKPEIIIVNTGSHDGRYQNVIAQFGRRLKINYLCKKGLTVAKARNLAARNSYGEVMVFLDDDCIVPSNWLKNVSAALAKYPETQAFLGKTENSFRSNPYACVFQTYYLRWLMENFPNINKTWKLDEGANFFNSNNFIFRNNISRLVRFDEDLPNSVLNEDLVLGKRLRERVKVLYVPNIKVFHANPDTMTSLFHKNYLRGVANEFILLNKHIDTRKAGISVDPKRWLKVVKRETMQLSKVDKEVFWFVFFLYPWPYKIGRRLYRAKYENRTHYL